MEELVDRRRCLGGRKKGKREDGEAGRGEITLHNGHKREEWSRRENCRSMRMEDEEEERGTPGGEMGCEMGLRK